MSPRPTSTETSSESSTPTRPRATATPEAPSVSQPKALARETAAVPALFSALASPSRTDFAEPSHWVRKPADTAEAPGPALRTRFSMAWRLS